MATRKTKPSAPPRPHKPPGRDMLEKSRISPWTSVGKILPTSTKKKEDVFRSFVPTKPCVDYNISETWLKMQKGDLKINLKETVATYEEIPPEICKPEKTRKIKYFDGGPPQYEFVDEIWRRVIKDREVVVKKEVKAAVKAGHAERGRIRKNAHERVQNIVGPAWFMELSPQQLSVIDTLEDALCSDFCGNTTENCKEVLAGLGLVLRPNDSHIRRALRHSCGDSVEFLLVFYQLLNPSRTSYSLNDRLLLSAVVHLSITSTLEELHVRIPSPPPEKRHSNRRHRLPNTGKAKKKCRSPYLQPLTFNPPPPKFSGVYTNKHRQYPESRYFAYLDFLEAEIRSDLCYIWVPQNKEMRDCMRDFVHAAQFYNSLPRDESVVKNLKPPRLLRPCHNLLHPRVRPPDPRLTIPQLCKVSPSEEVTCFCKEGCLERVETAAAAAAAQKKPRSVCEKFAQKYLGSLCLCDDCIENVRQKNLTRIHGGFRKTPCSKCEDPVPVIMGTSQSKVCSCYTEYRNKIVAAAAMQQYIDGNLQFVFGSVVMTKFGPAYNITATKGDKICLCNEILERKAQLQACRDAMLGTKFVITGVATTRIGVVYSLASVVARKPCKCILRYREKLAVLLVQNDLRTQSTTFVNGGLTIGKQGPVFQLSGVSCSPQAVREPGIAAVCSCEIAKPRCFNRCLSHLEYKEYKSSTEESGSGEGEETSTSSQDVGESSGDIRESEPSSPAKSTSSESNKSTSHQSSSTSRSSTSSSGGKKKETGKEEESTSSEAEGGSRPKPCTCKDELNRFLSSKCPCEECNRAIRQSYATRVMGATVISPSGNQINVVQGTHQPLCSCLHDHQETVRKLEEYRERVKARYKLKKQPLKYCISGVTQTSQGPVYVISGIRPPVECECGQALREKEEAEAYQKQRAKPPNTGRVNYEITGVKAMPEENVYVMSSARAVPPCGCEKLLDKFEQAHRTCMDEFQKYLDYTEVEKVGLDRGVDDETSRMTLMQSMDISFAQGFEKYPNMLTMAPPVKPAVNNDDMSDGVQEVGAGTPVAVQTTTEVPQQPPGVGQESRSQAGYTVIQPDLDKCEESTTTSSASRSSSSSSTASDDESSESETDESGDESESGSCHVSNPPPVEPITIPKEKVLPDSYLSKRYAIFRKMPKSTKSLMKVVKHILKGMAEDGYPLAKMPEVEKLPIIKLWLKMRVGVYWTYSHKVTSCEISKSLWKHTDVCYTQPLPTRMPYRSSKANKMTWRNAKEIRRVAAQKSDEFYRTCKQKTVETGREFFATTFAYEFPTPTWRDCAFAYLPTKEENLFPYKIVQPHDSRFIPENKKIVCYC